MAPRADVVAEHLHRLRTLGGRPWLADAILERPPTGPAMIAIVEEVLERLRPAAATPWAKLEALGVLTGLLYTSLRNQRPGGVLTPEFAAVRMSMLGRAATGGGCPRIAEVVSQGPSGGESADQRLARIVGLVLDGPLTRS